MLKLLHNCTHLTHKVMLKILQAQASTVRETEIFQMFKLVLEKAEGTGDQIANIC